MGHDPELALSADGSLTVKTMPGSARMRLLLGLSVLGREWDGFDDQERMEVFMGLGTPPQWVAVEDNPAAVRTVTDLERNGYLRTGWHHGNMVYKLTSKGAEAAEQIMTDPSLAALACEPGPSSADAPRRCAWGPRKTSGSLG
jgi:hypothetical protein